MIFRYHIAVLISFKTIMRIMVAVSIRKLFQRFAVHDTSAASPVGELLNHRVDCLAKSALASAPS